ncbi:MAG TPA: formimidoylglutamate deiminase [Ilumatobacteraceae bacterium]|nr:formimidoylglutamate deiminase [Ilumatobacteraceae bacterium]
MPSFHCELAWLGGEQAATDVVVEVDGERVRSVRPSVPATPAGATRLPGLTLPGFANAHSHAFHRALRGRTQRGTGSFWTWRRQMYELAATLDPDRYFRLARATYGEMALAGIAAVGEFHYLHHAPGGAAYAEPNAMADAVVAAAREAGIRITLLDACYLRGGPGVELDPVQRRFSDGSADAWAERTAALRPGPGLQVGAAVHSVRAVDPAAIAVVAASARARRVPLHAHVSEQPAENEQVRAAHGATPVEVLAGAGALDARFTAVHATHLTATDIGLLGAARCSCCICPTTERDLADGIGPTFALRDAGARLALGSDSHAVIDVLEEARAVELDERLATLVRGRHDTAALLRMATEHGHLALGWTDAGRIEAGALADLTTVTLDSVRTAGTAGEDALAGAVFAAAAADVRHVVVGGRVVVRDGVHTAMDVAGELRSVLA